MIKFTFLFGIIFILFLGVFSVVYADETINFEATSNGQFNLWPSGNYGAARSFTPSADSNSQTLHVKLGKQGNPTGTFKVQIIVDNAGSPDETGVVESQDVNISTIAADQLYDFDFTASLESGTQYWVYISRDGLTTDGSNYLKYFNYCTGGCNTGLVYYTNDGSSFSSDYTDIIGSLDLLTESEEAEAGTSTPLTTDGFSQTVFQGFLLFFLAMWFPVWYFRGKAI